MLHKRGELPTKLAKLRELISLSVFTEIMTKYRLLIISSWSYHIKFLDGPVGERRDYRSLFRGRSTVSMTSHPANEKCALQPGPS